MVNAVIVNPVIANDFGCSQTFPCSCEFRIQLDRPTEQTSTFRKLDAMHEELSRFQVHLIGIEIIRCHFNANPLRLVHTHFTSQRLHDRIRDFVLNGKNVHEVTVKIFRPQMPIGSCLNQLRRNPNTCAILAHTSLKDVPDIQFT